VISINRNFSLIFVRGELFVATLDGELVYIQFVRLFSLAVDVLCKFIYCLTTFCLSVLIEVNFF